MVANGQVRHLRSRPFSSGLLAVVATMAVSAAFGGHWGELHPWYPPIQVGARFSYFRLVNNVERIYDNGRFVGGFTRGISIDRLVERQNPFPLPFVRLIPIPALAVEAAWERMVLITRTYWDYHSDGDLILSGPSLTLIGRLPLTDHIIAYLGLGRVFWNASFDHWDDFYAAGRTIEVRDTKGTLWSVGCEVRAWRQLSVDLAVRHLRTDVDSLFYIDDPPRDGRNLYNIHTWTFPLDNWTWLLAATWTF